MIDIEDCQKVYALREYSTDFYLNRVHKDFRRLTSNTAFYQTINQAKRALDPLKITHERRNKLKHKDVEIVEIRLVEKWDAKIKA